MEIHYLPVLGLLLVVAGWLLQYKAIDGKKKEMKKEFALIYAAGVVLLIADGCMGGLYDLAAMNFISFVVALGVYLKMG